MARSTVWLLAILAIPAVVVLHLLTSPYTKVEESFNIQAVHDILAYGIPTEHIREYLEIHYDHMTFPGAVPRTFIGALLLAGLSKPFTWINSGVERQQLARLILGLFNAFSLVAFAIGVRKAFGKPAAIWYAVLQASQFHLIYYASRPLPNMFAFGISTFALSYLPFDSSVMSRSTKHLRLALYLMTLATIVFRAELALLIASHTIFLLGRASDNQSRISLIRSAIIPPALAGALIGLPLTTVIDSFFWQSPNPVWPELSAFLSNVFPTEGGLGASAWGTSPWHWYLSSALPRVFLNPLTFFLIAFSFTQPYTRQATLTLTLPNLMYIGLYSFLAHKETRFLFPVIPPLTASAALSASFIFTRRHRSLVYRFAAYAIVLSTILTFFASHAILLPISALNYPGAFALNALHASRFDKYENERRIVNVHLDNLACQTGVTRFLQIPNLSDSGSSIGSSVWTYDKSDNETDLLNPLFWSQFDYAIMETPSLAIGAWDVIDTVYGLRRPRITRPGGGDPAPKHLQQQQQQQQQQKNSICEIIEELYGPNLARGCSALEDTLMMNDNGRAALLLKGVLSRMTRGYGVDVGLEPKLYVLKKAASPRDVVAAVREELEMEMDADAADIASS